MQRIWKQWVWAGVMLLLSVGSPMWSARAGDAFSWTIIQTPNGTNYNIILLHQGYLNSDLSGPEFLGPLESMTNVFGDQPFSLVADSRDSMGLGEDVYVSNQSFPSDFYGPVAYTLTYSNASTNVVPFEIGPQFVVLPTNQVAWEGSNVMMTAVAYHYASFQWQKDGTNLVEDGHFIGVTNETLVISNAGPSDAGDYGAYASIPGETVSTFDYWGDTYLSVFKPFAMGLSAVVANGGYELTMSNQDGSAMDPDEISHIIVNSTTDLTVGVGNWNTESATGGITNGVYEVIYPWDGSVAKFYQVGLGP